MITDDIALWSPSLSFSMWRVLPGNPGVAEFCWWTGYRAVSPPPRTAQNSKLKSRPQNEQLPSIPFGVTLSYSSKINSHLYPQRVSSPWKKTQWNVFRGQYYPSVGFDSTLQIVMAVWQIFYFICTCWVGQLSADSNGRLSSFKFEKSAPNHLYLQRAVSPYHITLQDCLPREGRP